MNLERDAGEYRYRRVEPTGLLATTPSSQRRPTKILYFAQILHCRYITNLY
jgi:hypothetical protein